MSTGSNGNRQWKFDSNIAPVFVEHARQHIPNYEAVTNKCARYCALNLPRDSKIIDVGCATGYTLKKLHDSGFTNLHGVDNSEDMLRLTPPGIATYHVSEVFPSGQYDMILCNWTLHFIKDKVTYLQSMYDGLRDGGAMILSDKTSKDERLIKMYHDHKLNMGVPEQLIEEKRRQIENVMFINSSDWYRSVLKELGWTVDTIDADWCFTTFLCRK
jgi:tRNA (cmo5U34)-methyltransferase